MIVWPDRLLSDIAAHCSHLNGGKITVHTVKLGLTLRYRAHCGMSLDEVVEILGYSRAYGRRIASLFGVEFADFTPANPLNLPLE